MRVYKINADGRASDLRFEPEGYAPRTDERALPGFDRLPDIETLHEKGYVDALTQTREIEGLRAAALRALGEQRLAAALADPDAPQEVKDYAAAIDNTASASR